MRTRPKPPQLVSMWMLDVFCCALGCVTLLWLVSNRDAAQEATRNKAAIAELTTTRSSLLSTTQELEATRRSLNAQIDNLKAKLLATTSERDDTAAQLAVAKADVSSLETKLAKAIIQSSDLEEQLIKKRKDATLMAERLVSVTQSADELRKLLREKDVERDELALRAKKAADQLNDADAKLKALEKANDDAKSDLLAMRKTGDELATAKAAMRQMQKQIDDANINIIDLQGEKKKLADKIDKLRIESDSKFAGIAMTGKRVVFALDVSGSMKLLDDKTAAPEKWPVVVDTLVKVMRSLPDLEFYQIVLFSRTARYLEAGGTWQRYNGEETLNVIREKLLDEDPVGDTNMYDAFDLAFRLKASGLDTIYLFSDGLPTSGQGIPADLTKPLTDLQRSDYLTKHVRQTLRLVWNPERDARRVKINSIGFFFESNEVGAFLWALSRENNGSFVGMNKP